MFGLPIMLQIPREGVDHDHIYKLIVNRLKRCLKTSEADSELAVDSEANTAVPSEDPGLSDAEMDIDGAEDTPDTENGNDSSPRTNGFDSSKATSLADKCLFTMDFVNAGCNNCLDKLKPNGKPISLPGIF